ncbi:MAG: T9SS type A sorting domain-containing protein [Crocinitomix sp.]|nr:T9SS type A sorting domain-containing protein [Crocinitomix sp.]
MKSFVLIFAFLFSAVGFGQVWIDSNAVWNYKILHDGNPGHYEYNYSEDTLIMGELYQKITREQSIWYWDDTNWSPIGPWTLSEKYTYVSGDTVFYLFNDQFFVLFDFGASIGDQWMIADTNAISPSNWGTDTSVVEVIDTGTILIDTETYRTITLQTLDSASYALNGLFVERFGLITDSSLFHLFPIGQSYNPSYIVEPWTISFACFHDDSFPLYNPSGEECQYTPSNVGLREEDKQLFSLYPNPAVNQLNIATALSGTIQVFDSSGRKLKKVEIQGDEIIDISDLSKGRYFILFSNGSKLVEVQPFVVLR